MGSDRESIGDAIKTRNRANRQRFQLSRVDGKYTLLLPWMSAEMDVSNSSLTPWNRQSTRQSVRPREALSLSLSSLLNSFNYKRVGRGRRRRRVARLISPRTCISLSRSTLSTQTPPIRKAESLLHDGISELLRGRTRTESNHRPVDPPRPPLVPPSGTEMLRNLSSDIAETSERSS